jgi:hypothetical protein
MSQERASTLPGYNNGNAAGRVVFDRCLTRGIEKQVGRAVELV